MNIWEVTLTLVKINSSIDEEGKVTISGTGKFQYYDNKQWMECPIPFTAKGNAALVVDNAGIGGIILASGRFNLFKTKDNLNPRMLLNIDRAIPVQPDLEEIENIEESPSTVEPQGELVTTGINVDNNGHQKSEVNDDDELGF
ncbi:hypothetical protein PCC7424_5421 (plasmid) [Gloeothece citriformis PCC 7424]|uniref:Uncharacterized protein n=1 Tax=Gloeothece citriformis (strain PCC 7424) TaxID=65393 RepID=B7KMH4_GLOC7|nr:hypothetical protein [Gloeothece citriformis]ACK73996.1 hypothetical protein PCC7424_5421 [Gloeothece citriformis PCC 7424]